MTSDERQSQTLFENMCSYGVIVGGGILHLLFKAPKPLQFLLVLRNKKKLEKFLKPKYCPIT